MVEANKKILSIKGIPPYKVVCKEMESFEDAKRRVTFFKNGQKGKKIT